MIDKLTDRLKKIKLPLIKRIWDSDILLAIVINFIFLSAILLFCDVKYEVSDDFIMSAIMSGAYGSAPNPHMIFSSILWGYLLLPFYYIFPVISWYLVFQLLLCFVSFTLVSYMVLKKLDRMMACMLITMLLTFFGDDVYILVQFTKTAMLAVMGGGIVFAWALFNEKSKTVKTISALVCLAGTLIRFSVVYIAGGFLLFILLVEFVKIILSKSDSVKKKKKVMSVLLPGVLVVFAAFGMKWADTYIYNQDAGYKYFREYGSARARVVDASDYGYEAYAEELEKIGVSENDYKLMRTWNFADDEVFSLEIMEKTAEIIANYKKNVELSKEALLENIQTRGLTGYPIGIASIILLILTIVFQRKNYGFSFVINGIGGLYILYFFMRERVVYRIEYAVFLGVFLGMLYFWENIGMKSDGISKENNVEIARICAIINLVCVIAEAPLFLPDRSYLDVASEGRKEYVDYTFFESWNYDARKYRKVVNKGIPENYLLEEIKKNKENFYFLDFQTTMQTLYYEWNPFFALRPGYFDNSLYFASVMTNFPETLDVFREYDIEQPLKSLIEENVYLVDQDSRTLRNKVQYLQEHGYPDARAELYKDISGYQIWKICEE